MEPTTGSTKGWIQATAPEPPPSAAKVAAQEWAASRDRLNRALMDHQQAVGALDAARQEESAAWDQLQIAAERAPAKDVKSPSPVRTY